jgi:hypothetical protein
MLMMMCVTADAGVTVWCLMLTMLIMQIVYSACIPPKIAATASAGNQGVNEKIKHDDRESDVDR